MALTNLQKIWMKVGGIPLTREVVQNIKAEAENKELRIELLKERGLRGRLQKIYNNLKKQREDLDFKKEISEKLSEEARKLEKDELGEYISLDNFMKKVYGVDTKKSKGIFGEKIIFTDRNGVKSYKYGGIGFYTKGFMSLRDSEGNDLVIANLPRKLFKIESFASMLKKGIIQMNVDENLQYHSEWEKMEIPNQYYDEEDHIIKETEELQVLAKDIIGEKIMENRSLRDKIQQFEIAYSDISAEINNFKRTVIILSKNNKTTNADFSSLVNQVSELQKNAYQMSQKIVNITEENAMNEELIESQGEQIKTLKQKAEIVGSNTAFENVASMYDDITDKVTGRAKKVEAKQ